MLKHNLRRLQTKHYQTPISDLSNSDGYWHNEALPSKLSRQGWVETDWEMGSIRGEAV